MFAAVRLRRFVRESVTTISSHTVSGAKRGCKVPFESSKIWNPVTSEPVRVASVLRAVICVIEDGIAPVAELFLGRHVVVVELWLAEDSYHSPRQHCGRKSQASVKELNVTGCMHKG